MTKFNIISTSVDINYQNGLLPQRNKKNIFYEDSSCRCVLSNLHLSSENRRIIRKTEMFTYEIFPIFYNIEIQKHIFTWIKKLGWEFPISSVKQIFTDHIFNFVYVWKSEGNIVAYSVCYFSAELSHIAYVFYDPNLAHSDLPIRLVLQFVIDSANKNLKYAYLGRFSKANGYYKRNMPNFEYFQNKQWLKN